MDGLFSHNQKPHFTVFRAPVLGTIRVCQSFPEATLYRVSLRRCWGQHGLVSHDQKPHFTVFRCAGVGDNTGLSVMTRSLTLPCCVAPVLGTTRACQSWPEATLYRVALRRCWGQHGFQNNHAVVSRFLKATINGTCVFPVVMISFAVKLKSLPRYRHHWNWNRYHTVVTIEIEIVTTLLSPLKLKSLPRCRHHWNWNRYHAVVTIEIEIVTTLSSPLKLK